MNVYVQFELWVAEVKVNCMKVHPQYKSTTEHSP